MSRYTPKLIVYHPAKVFEERRRQQDALKELNAQAEAKRLENIDPATGKPREQEDDPVMKARKNIGRLMAAMNQLKGFYENLIQLCQSAQNSSLDDEDRKEVNKKFQKVKADIDNVALNTEIDGARIFSGEYSEKSHAIVLDPEAGADEAIQLRSEAMTCDALGVARVRIDSLVNARKAQQELEENARKVVNAITLLEGKNGSLEFQAKKVLERREASKTEQASDNIRLKEGENPFQLSALTKVILEENRRAQDRAHRYTQETAGLIVNRRY